MREIIGQLSLGETCTLHPFQILELVMDLCIKEAVSHIPRAGLYSPIGVLCTPHSPETD